MTYNSSSPNKPPVAKTAPTVKSKTSTPAAKPKKPGFFSLDAGRADVAADEAATDERYKKLLQFVMLETVTIAVLSGIFLFAMPFFMPVYEYYAMNPQKQGVQLVALTMPNMTNRAILSWATTSITEIMTLGFGDFENKLGQQQIRFTPEGWDGFRNAFIKQKIGESFKQNQLVLTTVPSNTPVIVAQGVNENHIYQWRVQMPVIMTYATNNNITKHEKSVIDLTIVRVRAEQSPSGIGIDSWSLRN